MLRELILDLLLPPFGLILIAIALSLWWCRRDRRLRLALCWLAFLALATPAISTGLGSALLAVQPRFDPDAPPEGRYAVVVPTAGATLLAGERYWPTHEAIVRAVTGQWLATRMQVPLLVSGGRPGDLPIAEALILADALGWGEEQAQLGEVGRDTCENARELADMLRPQGIVDVVAVTHRSHLVRFMACLRHVGLRPLAWSAAQIAMRKNPEPPIWVPGNAGLRMLEDLANSQVGLAWYLSTGRVGIRDIW